MLRIILIIIRKDHHQKIETKTPNKWETGYVVNKEITTKNKPSIFKDDESDSKARTENTDTAIPSITEPANQTKEAPEQQTGFFIRKPSAAYESSFDDVKIVSSYREEPAKQDIQDFVFQLR